MFCFRETEQLQRQVRAHREEMSLFKIPALQKEPDSLVSPELHGYAALTSRLPSCAPQNP